MRTSTRYPGVAIYEGALGEAPKAGAFYQPKAGDVLARIAKSAGTTYARIDAHPWNLENLVYVTKETGGAKCTPRATSLAQKKAGFISLCKVNGAYQEIWIPGLAGEGPAEVSSSLETKDGSAFDLKKDRFTGAAALRKKIADAMTRQKTAAEKQAELLNDGVSTPGAASIEETQEPVKAGMSTGMMIAIGGVALAAVVLFFVKPKKVSR